MISDIISLYKGITLGVFYKQTPHTMSGLYSECPLYRILSEIILHSHNIKPYKILLVNQPTDNILIKLEKKVK